MSFRKKIIAGAIAVVFIFSPFIANAQTIEELTAQIQQLLQLVMQLQQQLAEATGISDGGGGGTLPPLPPITSSCFNPTYNTYLGIDDSETNGDVTKLQRFLAQDASVYPEGLVTGYFGPMTEQAVKRWQAKHGVVSSGSPETTGYGVVGPKTRARIREVCGGTVTPPPILPPLPPPTYQCSDGIDNDGDGLVDYPSDPDCASVRDDNEIKVISCPMLTPPADGWCDEGIAVYPGLDANGCQQTPQCIISGTNLPPTISGVSGPTTLNVGQTGTWEVKASDPENGALSYSVDWGDSGPVAVPSSPAASFTQTSTFTHSYSKAGVYTPTFIVTDNTGQQAKTSISVSVGAVTQSSIQIIPITKSSTLALEGAIVEFNKFTLKNTSGTPAQIDSISIYSSGLFEKVLVQAENEPIFKSVGYSKINTNITIPAYGSKIIIISGKMSSDLSNNVGTVVSLPVNSIGTKATISGSLPKGAQHTINNTLTIGKISFTQSGSEIKLTNSSDSVEDVWLSKVFFDTQHDGGVSLTVRETGTTYSGVRVSGGGTMFNFDRIAISKGETITLESNRGYSSSFDPSYDIVMSGGTYGYGISPVEGGIVIQSPTVIVLSPNGGEFWETGKSYQVKWNGTDFPTNGVVGISLVNQQTGANNYLFTGYNSTSNDGIETITVPSNLEAGQYKIRIFCGISNSDAYCSGTNKEDFSDTSFNISSPTIAVSTIKINISADNEINSRKPDTVLSGSPYINIGHSTTYGDEIMRYLGKADVSSLAGKNIQKAVLVMDRVSNSWDDGSGYVFHPLMKNIDKLFDADTVTWNNSNNAHTLAGTYDFILNGVYKNYGIHEFDITSIAKMWSNGTFSHGGFMIKKANETSPAYGLFASEDYTGGETKPYLEVTYTD